MGFFEDVDAMGIAEANTQKLLGMEDDQGEQVIEIYRRVQKKLRSDLLQWSSPYLKERFTAQRLRGTLLQVEDALQSWQEPLSDSMAESGKRASIFSVESLQDEIGRYEDHFTGAVVPINLDALRIATESFNFLMNQYSVSFLNWSKNTRRQIEEGLQDAIVKEESHESVIGRLLKTFFGYEWQLRRIVRTEMHNIYNVSKIKGLYEAQTQYFPDMMKALYHPMDHRTADDSKQLAKLNPIIPITQKFRYTYTPPGSKKEYWREFMAPPDRPNDRAVLIPYRPAWEADYTKRLE